MLGVRRLRLLRDFIATQVEESLAAPDAEAVAQLQARARLSVDDQTLSFGEALGQLPHEPNRARRALLESATGGFLWDNRGRYGARREASFRLTERLRAPSYLALREDVSGIELNKLAEAAAETLRLAEDAYRDVLGYVLKVEPTLRPLPSGNARRHDLQAATQVPWMSGLFRREDLLPTVIRWLGEWGFHPAAEGRLRLDDEAPRQGLAPSAPRCACPEVRLVLQRRAGLDALGSLLHEYGHALHHAHVSEQLPLELRRLEDASVTEAFATLFERLLTDEEWLKRARACPRPPRATPPAWPPSRPSPCCAATARSCPMSCPSTPAGLARAGRGVRRRPAPRPLRRAAPGLLPLRRGPSALRDALPARLGAGDAPHRAPPRASARTGGAIPPRGAGSRGSSPGAAPRTPRRSPRSFRQKD